MNRYRADRTGFGDRGAGYGGGLVWMLVAAGGGLTVVLACLMLLSVSMAGQTVASEGASALVIRAVLRADVDPVGAAGLAERIRGQVPEVEMEIITETMGRALMALQEPWIAQMPDFEVTPLPILIEIHHPELLTNTAKVQQFVQQLEGEREVDFVAFNETAHTRLLALTGSIDHMRGHVVRWMLVLMAGAGFLMAALFGALMVDVGSWTRLLAMSAGVWVVALGVSWPVFHVWERGLSGEQEFAALPAGTVVLVGGVSLVVLLGGVLCGRLVKRWR